MTSPSGYQLKNLVQFGKKKNSRLIKSGTVLNELSNYGYNREANLLRTTESCRKTRAFADHIVRLCFHMINN